MKKNQFHSQTAWHKTILLTLLYSNANLGTQRELVTSIQQKSMFYQLLHHHLHLKVVSFKKHKMVNAESVMKELVHVIHVIAVQLLIAYQLINAHQLVMLAQSICAIGQLIQHAFKAIVAHSIKKVVKTNAIMPNMENVILSRMYVFHALMVPMIQIALS